MLRLTPVLPIKHHVKLRESASLSRNERDVVKISSECDAIQTAGGNFLYLCDHRINRRQICFLRQEIRVQENTHASTSGEALDRLIIQLSTKAIETYLFIDVAHSVLTQVQR
ncbi:hypothetical protein PSHT_05440 [Puccinia striiformis]|uniref:Uncharacterized protein n=1 Tax=Puccinia striiformis TaxID=27350 RepID=A0A2S4WA76_9BASI|nr:hypothetical protein PSHT_05440 [Puccinia striiformis]